MNICPCCKRAMPRTKTTKLDKRLSEDIAKAERAIANLEFNAANPPIDLATEYGPMPRFLNTVSPQGSFLAAIALELTRMRLALTDHRLLWSIYRRAEKKAPYYAVATEAEVAA